MYKETRNIAEKMRPLARAQYLQVARLLERTADKVQFLPVEDFEKTFEHEGIWMALHAKKAHLVAEQLKVIGDQLGNDEIIKSADEIEKWSQGFKAALKKSACEMKSEDMSGQDEGQDESQDEGQDEGSDEDGSDEEGSDEDGSDEDGSDEDGSDETEIEEEESEEQEG